MSVYKGVPPTQSDLLNMDGHGSLASIELVGLVRANGVHLLCLLSHMTHILQPLDVAVSKSFKSIFSKKCSRYLGSLKLKGFVPVRLQPAWTSLL